MDKSSAEVGSLRSAISERDRRIQALEATLGSLGDLTNSSGARPAANGWSISNSRPYDDLGRLHTGYYPQHQQYRASSPAVSTELYHAVLQHPPLRHSLSHTFDDHSSYTTEDSEGRGGAVRQLEGALAKLSEANARVGAQQAHNMQLRDDVVQVKFSRETP